EQERGEAPGRRGLSLCVGAGGIMNVNRIHLVWAPCLALLACNSVVDLPAMTSSGVGGATTTTTTTTVVSSSVTGTGGGGTGGAGGTGGGTPSCAGPSLADLGLPDTLCAAPASLAILGDMGLSAAAAGPGGQVLVGQDATDSLRIISLD